MSLSISAERRRSRPGARVDVFVIGRHRSPIMVILVCRFVTVLSLACSAVCACFEPKAWMLPGPIFRREVKAGARRRDLFRLRILFTTLLGVIAVVPAIVLFGGGPGVPEPRRVRVDAELLADHLRCRHGI